MLQNSPDPLKVLYFMIKLLFEDLSKACLFSNRLEYNKYNF
ncbi:hypothetical protein A1OE_666 [Candidatus Endolissoclinum faulkneri L2]|uniref:Uncharacterized protein n=1 Tax=Candidatus Endolissoclinum faulkneri L2 TaxID=1193729 RepID=K7YQM9_9PROT|nr:hypothetical protein A1OE_666 [Candidatus Endolissoclinum faulkneri L2]